MPLWLSSGLGWAPGACKGQSEGPCSRGPKGSAVVGCGFPSPTRRVSGMAAGALSAKGTWLPLHRAPWLPVFMAQGQGEGLSRGPAWPAAAAVWLVVFAIVPKPLSSLSGLCHGSCCWESLCVGRGLGCAA